MLACYLARIIRRTIRSEFKTLKEDLMSAQTEAFSSVLSELKSAVANKQSEMQAKIDAAVAAKGADDDAAFAKATDELRAMIASLTDHPAFDPSANAV